jgi:hypothetical protein
MAVTMTNMVFWVVTCCSSEAAERFEGPYRLHLQGLNVSQARDQQRQVENRAARRYIPEDRNLLFVECNRVTVRVMW